MVIKMSDLLRIRIRSLTSIADYFNTRWLQLKLKAHRALWNRKIIKSVPADEGDLTSMLDTAERQNILRRTLK